MAGRDTDVLDLGSWCVLRMASADTLRVFRSLVGAGFEVWTPIERRTKRMPRTRAEFDKEAALLPSYIFARVAHVTELASLSAVPNREHPPFSMFRYQGGIPLISDDQLDTLRAEEDRVMRVFEKSKRRGKKGAKLGKGSEVRMIDGPFAGMSGIVEDHQGQFTLVDMAIFGKTMSIKISSLLLAENMARDDLPSLGLAAEAA
jgi:transcription antitermination factor NusG